MKKYYARIVLRLCTRKHVDFYAMNGANLMNNCPGEKELPEALAKRFFLTWMGDADWRQAENMLDADFVWAGSGGVLQKLPSPHRLAANWDGKQKPVFGACITQQIGRDAFCVTGEFEAVPLRLGFRFSLVCTSDNRIHTAHVYAFDCMSDGCNRKNGTARINEERYEIAIQASGVTMFEYYVESGELHLCHEIADSYAVPTVLPNGVEMLVDRGIVHPVSVDVYREIFDKIHRGEPFASGFVKVRDKYGAIHDYELCITTIFDEAGTPVHAIGVRKNVSQLITLQRERQFGKSLLSDRVLVLEAELHTNRIEYMNSDWQAQLGGKQEISFDNAIQSMAENWVAEEHREQFMRQFSAAAITEAIQCGENLLFYHYKQKTQEGRSRWYEATAIIIENTIGQDMYVRFYLRDIDESKRREQKAQEEQRLYEAMMANAMLSYECNLSTGRIRRRSPKTGQNDMPEGKEDYMDVFHYFAEEVVYPEDNRGFVAAFDRDNVISLYQKGERQLVFEYRRKNNADRYTWVKCTMHLAEDPESGHIKGYIYIEDIDREKCDELALKFHAEHDAMTSFYNKIFAQAQIEDYLNSSEGKLGRHALFLIDIDYFKYVNDTFGHLFGDSVIREIAGTIRGIFRETDIMGRLGGDEFCVFMKNIESMETVTKRAEKLCTGLSRTYAKKERTCTVSASIGIAIYGGDGMDFTALYHHADKALYRAKGQGRNRFEL